MADPLYRRIAEDLRQKIQSGELAPGQQLPTELELREQYGNASRNTIRDAIKSLSAQRLVSTHPGRGTFVLETIDPFIVRLHTPLESRTFIEAAEQQDRAATASDPRVEIQNARPDVAGELRIDEGSQVVVRHQQRFIDGSPSSLQTSFYLTDFIQQGAGETLPAADIQDDATNYSRKAPGIRQSRLLRHAGRKCAKSGRSHLLGRPGRRSRAYPCDPLHCSRSRSGPKTAHEHRGPLLPQPPRRHTLL